MHFTDALAVADTRQILKNIGQGPWIVIVEVSTMKT